MGMGFGSVGYGARRYFRLPFSELKVYKGSERAIPDLGDASRF